MSVDARVYIGPMIMCKIQLVTKLTDGGCAKCKEPYGDKFCAKCGSQTAPWDAGWTEEAVKFSFITLRFESLCTNRPYGDDKYRKFWPNYTGYGLSLDPYEDHVFHKYDAD